jgi:hypothetical protein
MEVEGATPCAVARSRLEAWRAVDFPVPVYPDAVDIPAG